MPVRRDGALSDVVGFAYSSVDPMEAFRITAVEGEVELERHPLAAPLQVPLHA